MLLYLLIPLVLALLVLASGLLIYRRMRHTLPVFKSGRFWRAESHLLEVLEGLLDTDTANKLDQQVQYFVQKGKYWRHEDDTCSGIELLEEEGRPMDPDIYFGLNDEFDLARMTFALKEKKYEVVFQVACGRLWGWTITPALPREYRFSSVNVLEARLIGHSEVDGSKPKAKAASSAGIREHTIPVAGRRSS